MDERARAMGPGERGAALMGWAVAAMLAGGPAPASAQDEGGGIVDSLAVAIADSLAPRWEGPRTPWPEPRPRPEAIGVLRSRRAPVAVQVGDGVWLEDAEVALQAAERAHDYLADLDWPTPIPDGGYGGTGETDVYLVRGASDVDDADHARLAWASYDAPVSWAGLDNADAFAVVDADVDRARLEACVISAYVRAALLSADPAEARAWRVATGDYVAWLLTGQFGCSDEGIVRHQRESARTWVSAAPDSGEGGALFLALLSARTDGLTGRFIRDLWSGAAQRTWDGHALRAAPDLWQVIFAVMQVGQDPLPRLLEEMGVARYFAGPESRSVGAPISLLRLLPEEAAVPVLGRTRYEDLPRRFEPDELELEPYGSAYLEIDTSQAPPGSQVRVWLRGEYGVGWSLTAVRLAADGTERGRTRAPVRPRTPRSYIPVELVDGETAKIVIVVTNMGARLVDADELDDQVRSFRLILDREATPNAGVPVPDPAG